MLICVRSRVNPVEHIYAAFPMFLYLNASIGGGLLEPLLESQVSLTGQQFAAVDIGNTYPAATGSEAMSNQGVEREYPFAVNHAIGCVLMPSTFGVSSESGNMLIMELAHARISGDGTLLSQYVSYVEARAVGSVGAQRWFFLQYNTTKRWADYLVSNALKSENQYVLDLSGMDGEGGGADERLLGRTRTGTRQIWRTLL